MAEGGSGEHIVRDVAALEALYGRPKEPSIVKEVDYLHPHYRAFIRAARFLVLATAGPAGLDASPRGDLGDLVEIVDERRLHLADRRGNNRLDSLRNILHDPRVGLLFVIPGIAETLRVNGYAEISTEPALLARQALGGVLPRTILVIRVESVYFQCSRAILRADLWNPERHVARESLPSAGAILSALSRSRIDGKAYDCDLAGRIADSL